MARRRLGYPEWILSLLWVGTWAIAVGGFSETTWAAETTLPTPMRKTIITLKLDTDAALPIRTRAIEHPPTIQLIFPEQQIVGSLPEQTVIQQGIIQGLRTRYHSTALHGMRYLNTLEIILRAPYAYLVRSES